MSGLIYAIEIGQSSYGELKILDVKIGKTTNIKSTVAQYRRNSRPRILGLWKPNMELTLSSCEMGVHKIAEKYAHERDSEKFIFLQDNYENFSKNINLLLEKTTLELLKKKSTLRIKEPNSVEYTGKKPKFIKFQGETKEVKTWREVLQAVAKQIHDEKKDFSKVMEIKGRKRTYFTKNDKEKLVSPVSIPNTPYFFEGNISANRTMKIINELLPLFGFDASDLEIDYHK